MTAPRVVEWVEKGVERGSEAAQWRGVPGKEIFKGVDGWTSGQPKGVRR